MVGQAATPDPSDHVFRSSGPSANAPAVGLGLWWATPEPCQLFAAEGPGFPIEARDPMVSLRLAGRRARYAVLLDPFCGQERVQAFRVADGESANAVGYEITPNPDVRPHR